MGLPVLTTLSEDVGRLLEEEEPRFDDGQFFDAPQ